MNGVLSVVCVSLAALLSFLVIKWWLSDSVTHSQRYDLDRTQHCLVPRPSFKCVFDTTMPITHKDDRSIVFCLFRFTFKYAY